MVEGDNGRCFQNLENNRHNRKWGGLQWRWVDEWQIIELVAQMQRSGNKDGLPEHKGIDQRETFGPKNEVFLVQMHRLVYQ